LNPDLEREWTVHRGSGQELCSSYDLVETGCVQCASLSSLRPGQSLKGSLKKGTKSPDFEEVTDRSQLDISEPYKVYRIVPEEEQKCNYV
jgi:hypothetical protein